MCKKTSRCHLHRWVKNIILNLHYTREYIPLHYTIEKKTLNIICTDQISPLVPFRATLLCFYVCFAIVAPYFTATLPKLGGGCITAGQFITEIQVFPSRSVSRSAGWTILMNKIYIKKSSFFLLLQNKQCCESGPFLAGSKAEFSQRPKPTEYSRRKIT